MRASQFAIRFLNDAFVGPFGIQQVLEKGILLAIKKSLA